MGIQDETLAASRKYTQVTVAGAGAIKGVPCQIESITAITGGHRVTYLWEDNEGVSHTSTMDVMDGAKGDKGEKGDRGDVGATGPQGAQGIQGIQGPQGIAGTTGPQGVQGIQGIQGEKGDDGYPFLIYKQYDDISEFDPFDFPEIGLMFMVMTEDYDPEDPSTSLGFPIYRYIAEGTPPYSLVCHLASQGIKGDKGDKGDTGAQGVQGIQGPQGEKGDKGDTGAQGPQGPQGVGVPDGGVTGQVLGKKSGTDYDTEWVDRPVITVDSELSDESTNSVQNKVITGALDTKVDKAVGKGLSTNDYSNADKAIVDGVTSALSGKVDTSSVGVANGIAELGADGKVVASQLPAAVDTIVEGYYKSADGKFYEENTYETEITPQSNVIYVSLDTDKTYRWSGTQYVEISASLALGETAQTAYAGNKGKANADAITAIKNGQSLASFGDVETALGDKISKSNTAGLVKNDGTIDTTQYLTQHQDITGKADKVSGATNGNFAGLDGNGNLTDSGSKASDFLTQHQDITGKADKVSGATNGNFAGLNASGNLTDSGKKASDFVDWGAYSEVATSGINHFKNTAVTGSSNAVTFTINDDGTVTASGTVTGGAPANKDLLTGIKGLVIGKTYKLVGLPADSTNCYVKLFNNDYSSNIEINSTNKEKTFVYDGTNAKDIQIGVRTIGTVVNDRVFKPMIVDASYKGDYVPYAMGNKELTDVIPSGASASNKLISESGFTAKKAICYTKGPDSAGQTSPAVPYDANEITANGIYSVNAAFTTHLPFSQSTWVTLYVTHSASNPNYCQQIAINGDNGDIYIRKSTNKTWGSWRRVAMTDEVTSGTTNITNINWVKYGRMVILSAHGHDNSAGTSAVQANITGCPTPLSGTYELAVTMNADPTNGISGYLQIQNTAITVKTYAHMIAYGSVTYIAAS